MMDMAKLKEWMAYPILDNPVWLWAAAALATLVVFFILIGIRRFVVGRLKKRAAEHPEARVLPIVAGVIGRTHGLTLLALGILAGSLVLDLGPRAAMLRKAIVVATLLQAGFWASALMNGIILRWREEKTKAGENTTGVVALQFLGRLALWAVVFLIMLENLGIEVTALLAGLGVGGIAVALAAQNILGDLFGSISILLDKPFEIGDFIIVGDLLGVVEHVGLKTTRVRSLGGEQIVFANSDLLGARIRNFKRMKERRIVFSLGVTYQTPLDKVGAIPGWLKEIVESCKDVRFDRAHFQKYGDFALVYEVVYYMLTPDYAAYMDRQQEMNLAIYDKFAKEGVEFAYPTQTLFLVGPGAAPKPA